LLRPFCKVLDYSELLEEYWLVMRLGFSSTKRKCSQFEIWGFHDSKNTDCGLMSFDSI
jgi:hypothetical protein